MEPAGVAVAVEPPCVAAVAGAGRGDRATGWRCAARRTARRVTPAWFASVMGTGIVAVALTLLPVRLPGAGPVAVAFWLAAATLLVLLTGALAARAVGAARARVEGRRAGLGERVPASRRVAASGALLVEIPRVARAWGREVVADPAVAATLGVPPMAAMTVAAATSAVGGGGAAGVAMGLWLAGTAGGAAVPVVVARAMVVRHRVRLEDVSGTWLLAMVPPVVSASTGAGLVAHLPAGEARLDLLIVLYGLLGVGLLGSLPLVALLWARLILHGPGPAERAPALWVVLGPLGQSMTAVALLGTAAERVVAAPTAEVLQAVGLAYGVVAGGFAALWLALAIALTRHHAARDGVPFSAAWWSFVFPVGTLVTGTSELAGETGSVALRGVALALFAGLVAAWAITATRALAAPVPVARQRRRPA